LNFNDAGSSENSEVEVPIVEAPDVSAEWLSQHASAMPAAVEKAIESSGHRVTKHRTLVPIRSQDGRLLLMPVEQVDVEPEDGPTY
jgi:hypothetical protein